MYEPRFQVKDDLHDNMSDAIVIPSYGRTVDAIFLFMIRKRSLKFSVFISIYSIRYARIQKHMQYSKNTRTKKLQVSNTSAGRIIFVFENGSNARLVHGSKF